MGGATGANYAFDYQDFDGIMVPTTRRVFAHERVTVTKSMSHRSLQSTSTWAPSANAALLEMTFAMSQCVPGGERRRRATALVGKRTRVIGQAQIVYVDGPCQQLHEWRVVRERMPRYGAFSQNLPGFNAPGSPQTQRLASSREQPEYVACYASPVPPPRPARRHVAATRLCRCCA